MVDGTEDLGVPDIGSPSQQEQEGQQGQAAPSYSLDTNVDRAQALGKDERAMMDTRTGVLTAIPKAMSDQEGRYWIENQDQLTQPGNFKQPFYNRVMDAVQTGGASENVFQPWSRVSEDFLKNGLQGLTANIYRPNQAEEEFYQKFQKDESMKSQMIGQLGAYWGLSAGVGAIAGVAARTIPAISQIFTGMIAKIGMEGAIKAGNFAGAGINMEAAGTAYQSIANIQNKIKDNEETVRNGGEATPIDYSKEIMDAAGGQTPMWALVAGAGSIIAKPIAEMSGLETSGEVAKRIAFNAGSSYVLMRASGSSHEDSLLGAGLMGGLSALHGITETADAETRGKILQESVNQMARYMKESNFAIPDPNAYEIGKQIVTDHADAVIEQSKPITEEERAGEQMAAEGSPVQRSQGEVQQEENEETEKQKSQMESEGGNPLEQIAQSHEQSIQLMKNLVSQVVVPEGEESTTREELSKEEESNAQSGRGSVDKSSKQAQGLGGQEEEGVRVRDNEKTGLETQQGEKVTQGEQKPVPSEGPQKKSRLFERVATKLDQELRDQPLYNQLNTKEAAQKAVDLQASNPDLVKRVAYGVEPAPEGYSETALRYAYREAMKDASNNEEAANSLVSTSLRGTRLGQEVNLYKLYKDGTEHDPDDYVKKAIQDRIKAVGKSMGQKGDPQDKVLKEVDNQKKIMRNKLDNATVDPDEIQKVIDSIICP